MRLLGITTTWATLLGSVRITQAWNTDVHNQIGHLATHFLSSHTLSLLPFLLEPQYNGSIGLAAAWADAYAHTEEGRYSYPWHWIDAHDNPPKQCGVEYPGDCAGIGKSPARPGCIISAIANQTAILRKCVKDLRRGLWEESYGVRAGDGAWRERLACSYALKWVVHFLGDITQPLHASGLAAGGNMINVTFGGEETELHAVWDGHILYHRADVSSTVGFPNSTLHPYFSSLIPRITHHPSSFLDPVSGWRACVSPATPIECALTWARDSNKWTCRYVYRERYNGTGLDLLESGYAERAGPIVEMQVAKAAVRLAEWLDGVVREEDEREVVVQDSREL